MGIISDQAVLFALLSVALVLAEKDPNHPNCVFTQGHTGGLMLFRFARIGK